MNNKLLPFISILLFISFKVQAQVDSYHFAKNIFYLEAGGIGGYGSLNYERIFYKTGKLWLSTRVGWSTYNLKDYRTKFNPDVLIPISIYWLYGNRHKAEIGLGQTISNIVHASYVSSGTKRKTNFHSNITIGYRYQKENGGLVFRCHYSPIIEFNKYYRHWGGISIGYSF